MSEIDIYIISRVDYRLKSYGRCYNYEINRDYITNEKSRFTVILDVGAEQGDYLLAKGKEIKFDIYKNSNIKPIYFGVVESLENNTIIACDFYNIFNFEIAATKKTGTSFGDHIYNLITKYFLSDELKLTGGTDQSGGFYGIIFHIDDSSKINHSYQPEEPPTPTNMVDYLINGFKKYSVVVDALSIGINQVNNRFTITANITRNFIDPNDKTKELQIKNNNYSFVNWDIYENTIGRNLENELYIIDKATTDSENPNILAKYYLHKDGTVDNVIDENIFEPTKTKIFIYDTTAEDKPSYDEVANSELQGKVFSHEINFDLQKDNKILPYNELKIGLLVKIVYADNYPSSNEKIYDTILTGYELTNNNNYMHLKFGNVRSTLREAIKT